LKRTKITDKITYVEPNSMANFSSCAGIIVQSKNKVMIDMNMGAKETPGLIEQEKPDAVILTHYHLDHSIWTRHVNTFSDAVIFIPEAEAPYLTSLDFFIEHTAGPSSIAEKWKAFTVNMGYKPLDRYECYNELTTFKDMAPEVVLVATPGHSPSHTSFYFPDEKIIQRLEAGMTKQEIIRQGVFFLNKEKVSEPMSFFLNMWDTNMYNHHEALIKEGGLMAFFPEIKPMLKLF